MSRNVSIESLTKCQLRKIINNLLHKGNMTITVVEINKQAHGVLKTPHSKVKEHIFDLPTSGVHPFAL